MRMCYAVDIRPCGMDCVMNCIGLNKISYAFLEGHENRPAALRSRIGPPSTTFPSLSTSIRSSAVKFDQAFPKGLTQKLVCSTGSCWMIMLSSTALLLHTQIHLEEHTLRVTCPLTPSSNPYLANIRNARARRFFLYSRS